MQLGHGGEIGDSVATVFEAGCERAKELAGIFRRRHGFGCFRCRLFRQEIEFAFCLFSVERNDSIPGFFAYFRIAIFWLTQLGLHHERNQCGAGCGLTGGKFFQEGGIGLGCGCDEGIVCSRGDGDWMPNVVGRKVAVVAFRVRFGKLVARPGDALDSAGADLLQTVFVLFDAFADMHRQT